MRMKCCRPKPNPQAQDEEAPHALGADATNVAPGQALNKGRAVP